MTAAKSEKPDLQRQMSKMADDIDNICPEQAVPEGASAQIPGGIFSVIANLKASLRSGNVQQVIGNLRGLLDGMFGGVQADGSLTEPLPQNLDISSLLALITQLIQLLGPLLGGGRR
jgi:hypothetical protein